MIRYVPRRELNPGERDHRRAAARRAGLTDRLTWIDGRVTLAIGAGWGGGFTWSF
jgi:hypothetical protein